MAKSINAYLVTVVYLDDKGRRYYTYTLRTRAKLKAAHAAVQAHHPNAIEWYTDILK